MGAVTNPGGSFTIYGIQDALLQEPFRCSSNKAIKHGKDAQASPEGEHKNN
jgi:hypothetical protein